jgi:four helix bundle protein
MATKPYDIRQRAFLFACESVALCRLLAERGYVMRRLAAQLVDAAGSVGANLEEASEGQSKADFISKNYIALKECREACYWLRLISASDEDVRPHATPLIHESRELIAILTAIVIKAKSSGSRDRRDEEKG